MVESDPYLISIPRRPGRFADGSSHPICVQPWLASARCYWPPDFLSQGSPSDPRLKKASRQAPRNGWTFVHLEGSPSEIGFQNGYLLAPEIADQKAATELEVTHDSKKSWSFFRDAARDMMWPHIEPEYREEMEGIAEGLKARGVDMDIWDVVALNAADEWGYYISEYDKQHGVAPPPTAGAPEHCSAFVATGSYTRDGQPVIAHNDWSSYLGGERWTIVYDIVPEKGNRILMDGGPGVIDSADDFGLNSAGIVITETTISNFFGYDPNGIPEFVRARKAMQYSVRSTTSPGSWNRATTAAMPTTGWWRMSGATRSPASSWA